MRACAVNTASAIYAERRDQHPVRTDPLGLRSLFRPCPAALRRQGAPKKIAFIQCVGSRDTSCGNSWCSSVCCMYATKEAIIGKEHAKELEPTIFFMDIRAHGKDFDRFVNRAKEEYGIRYIRSMPSTIKELQQTQESPHQIRPGRRDASSKRNSTWSSCPSV